MLKDPQGVKGPCDRKAAVIKSHTRSHLDSGHDISNAEEMKLAIESSGGVRGVPTILCGPLTIPDPNPFPKWDGVSLLNDIKFYSEEMRIWRAYGVGDGKVIPYSNFHFKGIIELPFFDKASDIAISDLSFSELKPKRRQVDECTSETVASAESNSETDDDTLFTCPEEGCVKTFQRFSSLHKHLDGGSHKYALERESLLDKAMLRYAENLESGASSIEENVEAIISEEYEEVSFAKVGRAIKHAHTSRRRLNDKQKNYIIELFLFGEKTGRKADASEVSKTMRKARNEDGSLLFQSDEYLTSMQITSFFSRLAAKKSVQVSSSTSYLADEDDRDDLLSAMAEQELEEIRQEVINEISIQHPITFQSYNICEMAATSQLSKFSIAMLEEICKNFELDTSTI